MRYLTDRKRAVGRGAAHSGTANHWHMQISAVGLALMIPTFLYIFGSALGSDHADVLAVFARPVPAIITGLLLVVGMQHFRMGMRMVLEDYTSHSVRKVGIMIVTIFSYGLTATGLFALAKIAL